MDIKEKLFELTDDQRELFNMIGRLITAFKERGGLIFYDVEAEHLLACNGKNVTQWGIYHVDDMQDAESEGMLCAEDYLVDGRHLNYISESFAFMAETKHVKQNLF